MSKDNERIVKHIIDNLSGGSWIEIGSASKCGAFKVYVNPNDVKGSKEKIDNMFMLLEYANQKMRTANVARKVF